MRDMIFHNPRYSKSRQTLALQQTIDETVSATTGLAPVEP